MISSRSNPIIKRARSLRQTKARDESGLFLVEGVHHVGEAIAAGWEVEALLYAPEQLRSEFAQSLLAQFAGRIEELSVDVLGSLSAKENPQGIIALVHKRQSKLDGLSQIQIGVAVVSPQDPGNVGTILRTMDAVGAGVLFLLDGGVDPYHPSAVRASMGALFWKPVVQAPFGEFDSWRRGGNYQLVGSSAGATLHYTEFTPTEPWILLLGSEQTGLSDDQKQAADALISLPMLGRASSLNLAVAAGVLLYAYCDFTHTDPRDAGG